MKHTSKILLSVLLLSTAGQITVSAPVFADTFTGNGSGGTWNGEDGATDVSTIVLSSYTVQIPATLELPKTDTYTTQSNNVEVLSGAHIPSDQSITVKLGTGQTFSAANGENDAVAYKVKLADGTKLTGTTDAYDILDVSAADAHENGGATSVNVGFDTAPDFKFAGIYTDHVQFDVSTSPAPTDSPVVLNGDGTLTFAGATWQILVDGDNDLSAATNKGDYLAIREDALTNNEIGTAANDVPATVSFGNWWSDIWFGSGSSLAGNGYERGNIKPIIDAYSTTIMNNPDLAQGVLPVNLNNMTYNDFKNGNFGNKYFNVYDYEIWYVYDDSWAADVRGATTVDETTGSQQAFILSYGDIQTLPGIGPGIFQSNLLASKQGLASWVRSPGKDCEHSGLVNGAGKFNETIGPSIPQAIRPAFWLTTN